MSATLSSSQPVQATAPTLTITIKDTKVINIYKITNPNIPNKCYVGSTSESLVRRLDKHRYEAKRRPNSRVYKECGGIDNCEITLLESVLLPTYNFKLLRAKKEQEWIDFLKPEWNKIRSYITPEEKAAQQKKYWQSAKGKECKRRYYQKKKEKEKKEALRQMADD